MDYANHPAKPARKIVFNQDGRLKSVDASFFISTPKFVKPYIFSIPLIPKELHPPAEGHLKPPSPATRANAPLLPSFLKLRLGTH
ncbi:MAG: hypothetical protein WCD79_20060 [Chthoniobacteraceae bacterium]